MQEKLPRVTWPLKKVMLGVETQLNQLKQINMILVLRDNILIIHKKKLLDSDWLNTVQFVGNKVQKKGNSVQIGLYHGATILDKNKTLARLASQRKT